jgi:hypothetical protein
MKALNILNIGIALAAFAAVGLVPKQAYGSNEIAKKEGVSCTKCHDKPGSKLLTDRGKYYELKKSLEGFDELKNNFGRCTSCHVRKPGSLKLTDRGKRYRWIFNDMEGIKDWLMKLHVEEGESPTDVMGGDVKKTDLPAPEPKGSDH